MATWVCRILGAILVGIGLLVIVRGGQVDPYHNLLHVATGAIALYVGFLGPSSGARAFCLGFGAAYLAFGALGLVLGDPLLDRQWQVGPMSLDTADHVFHVMLGLVFLASGVPTRRDAPSPRVAAR